MPRKNTKDAYIHTIMSRINYMMEELACRDRKIEILLSQRNLDVQSPQGFLKTGEYDRYLGGRFEETLYNEDDIAFGHLPDPDNPIDIDMSDFWRSFLSSPYVFWLYLLLRRRLIRTVYRRPSQNHDGGPGDPCGILPSLKTITPDQLARLASKLKRALPASRAGRPQKMLWDASLADIDLVRAVKESPSKGVTEACTEVAANHTRSCEDAVDAVTRRFYRIVELFRAPE